MKLLKNRLYTKAVAVCMLLTVTLMTRGQHVRIYDDEQLSSNQITSLCQDSQGYIWIGTEYGLNKFDGVHVTQYYNDDTDSCSLSDDIVRCMMTDRDGYLWVVNNRGVQRYNRMTDRFDNVHFDDGPSANIHDILQTPDGHIWLLSAISGIIEVDADLCAKPKTNFNKHLRSVCDNMYLDSKGRLWIAYQDTGLQLINTKTGKSRYFERVAEDAKRAGDMTEDSEHHMMVLSNGSVLQYNESKQIFEPLVTFPPNTVYNLLHDSHGHLLFGTSGSGIWTVDLEKRTITQLENEDNNSLDLADSKVTSLLKDKNGNLWVGCYQKGLLFLSDKDTPFQYLPLNRMQNNNGHVLRSVFADSSGHVYVCQEKGGLTDIDTEGHTLCHWMDDYTVMTVHEDGKGTFWVGTFRNGLFRIDPRKGSEEWLSHTGTQRIGSITHDHQGNLYTAVFNNGLHSYTPDGKTERILGKGKLKLMNIYLNTLFTDKKGRIWIGHYYGIDVYDPKTDQLVDVGIDPALRPAIVYAIGQSQDGTIWIGCNKGLFKYKEQAEGHQWERLTTKNGLPNNIVCGLVITAEGTVWVSTYHGLGKISPDGHISSYYRGNGLQTSSYLRSAYALSVNGEIIFGHQNGITRFFPKNLVKDHIRQEIMLTGMRLGNIDVNTTTRSEGSPIIKVPIDETEEITVSYLDNTFSLKFSTMDYRDARNVHYEYRFDDEPADVWHQTAAGSSEVYLSHLSAGRHQLHVRVYDNGVRSKEKVLTIHVTPPWYRSWWAYIFYLLMAAGIAVLGWRNYWNRRLAETNEEKIKFFVDISHELRSPLTLIKSPLDKLLKSSQGASDISALRVIERNTNRLLTLTNQILSIRKIEKGQMQMHFAETPLGDFINDICHDYDYQVEKRQISLTFDNQAGDMKVWIDRDHFDKVVTNLLGNALKYVDDGGEIAVILRKTADSQAELNVRDNGTGIDEAQLRKIFERFYQASARPAAGQMSYGIGLNLTQKIVKMHHGTISARNRTDVEHGSEFIVRLPLGCQHLPQDQLVDNDYYTMPTASKDAVTSNVIADTTKPQRIRRKTTYHIAVVDDDEDIRQFLQTELSDSYHVHTYADGQKALEGISDLVPDLVISDVVMPVMDGFELLKRIKGSTTTSHIPVILLTTKTDHLSRVVGLDQGADAYVDKPFNLEELEARIGSLIANRIRIRGKFTGVQEQEENVRKIELKGNDAALMEKIMKAVNDRFDDDTFNVEALADDIGMSRAQLHRRMKELTGITVSEFIRNLRLQQAAKLLAAGDTSVAQVTYAVGFSNPNHFTTAFKRHFGVTPSEYMAKHKEKNFKV